jgi:hypothetical protein
MSHFMQKRFVKALHIDELRAKRHYDIIG